MLNDNLITRFQNGITNNAVNNIFSSLPMPDPTKLQIFHDDFHRYVAGDWTITTTEAGAGAATEALTDANGGRLLVTNDDADDDADFFNKVGESFLFATGKKAFFKALLQVSDATQSDFVVGLQITDTTPLAVTDGVYFRKDDGDTDLDFLAIKDSTAVTASAISTVVDATDLEIGFYWDGIDRIWYSVGGTVLGSITPDTSLPDDELLTVSFGIQNGAAAAKTMTIDYIFAAMER